MFSFRRDHRIRHFLLLLALATLGAGSLVAETVNYGSDETLTATTVNTARFRSRVLPLSELLTQIEKQTWLRFVYDADRLPMGAEVVVPAAPEEATLARLLAEISTQVAVVFKRRSGLIGVFGKGPDDVVAGPDDPVVPAGFASAAEAPVAEVPSATTEGSSPAVEAPATAPEAPTFTVPSLQPTEVTPPPATGTLELEKFKVQGKAAPNSQAQLRQRASVAVDMLSSRDFSKYIATDVSDIIVRLPGLSTTTRGNFAVVRGLSERYNPVMMDGIGLPSSDPERQSPELDIFPTRLVDTIVISKAYEPRLPGTSSGASINLLSKPIPTGRFAQVQFGLRADEGLLKGDPFLGSDRPGMWDLLALGVKDRVASPPPALPRNAATNYVRSADTVSAVREEKHPVGTRFSVVYEDRVMLDEETGRAFGYGLSLGYDSSASAQAIDKFSVGNVFQPTAGAVNGNLDTGIFQFGNSSFLESEVETRIGLLATLGFAFTKRHQFAFSYFLSQIGIDTHSRTTGKSEVINLTYAAYQRLRNGEPAAPADPVPEYDPGITDIMELYYRQRTLTNIHVSGEHAFTETDAIKVKWDIARVGARQQEPEYLSFPFIDSGVDGPKRFQAPLGQQLSRYTRYWRDTQEKSTIVRLDADFTFDLGPLEDNQIRLGYYGDRTDRDYTEEAIALNGGELVGATVNELVKALQSYNGLADRFGGSNTPPFANADRTVDALYLSWLLPLAKDHSFLQKLDLLFGVRLEDFQMHSEGTGRIGNESSLSFYGSYRTKTGQPPVTGENSDTVFVGVIDERKSLPAVALNYSPIKNMTLRLAWSKTTARPSFREVGSYFTVDRVNSEYVHGNKDLTTSDVTNYDVRLEYFFPKSKDLMAVSVFKKEIERPIERLSLDLTNIGAVSTFVNNSNTAELKGVEVEAAKNLGFLGEVGSHFTVGGNYTMLDAVVARDAKLEAVQIASTGIADVRNLYDQPEWIANAYLTFDQKAWGFSSTLSWFGISDVLQKVNEYTWDTYVAAHTRIDLTMSQRFGPRWQLRLAAKNLTDPERKVVADPNNTNQEIVFRRFKDGRNYSLTATYDF